MTSSSSSSSSSTARVFPRCSIELKFNQMELKKLMVEEEEIHCITEDIASSIMDIQNMNNTSAFLIENGRYDRAISKLRKPLEILKAIDGINMKHTCKCYNCSLDGCIEQRSSDEEDSYFIQSSSNRGIKEDENLHVTPIRITKNHHMGSRLFLILTFNLALARHLKALNKKSSLSSIKNTIKLYKIVLDTMKHFDNTVATTAMNNSRRFNKILHKNLNHLQAHYLAVVSKDEENNEQKETAATSLYQKHIELIRNRFSDATSKTEIESSSSLNLLSKKTVDGFSVQLQNAMRTSSSFEHVQQRRNVRTAHAA